MKQIYTIMKASVKMGLAIIFIIVSPKLFAQNSNEDTDRNEVITTSETVFVPSISEDTSSKHAPAITNHGAASAPKDGHSLKLKPKATHTLSLKTIPKLSKDDLVVGNTYNRYGQLVFPSGYGIQVVAFKNLNNLQKYLHMYDNKDLFIQVSSQEAPEQLYRVILGANGNKISVEKELNLFNNAGIPAVLRRHKENPLHSSKLD